MSEDKEQKKRRTVLMEVLVIKSNINHIIQKIVNVESAINETELNTKKLLEEFNKQKTQLNVLEGMLDYLKTRPTLDKPQPPQQSEVTLSSVDKSYFTFENNMVAPKKYLPYAVWLAADKDLKAQGFKWVKNGKKGSWRKQ